LGKTKVMKYEARFGQTETVACGFKIRKAVCSNSMMCNQCSLSIHRRCGVSGKLQNVAGFRCERCVNGQLL